MGHKASEVRPSGVTTTYGYDVRHRLTFIRHSKGDLLLAQYRYTLDATGQRLGLEETDAQGQIKVTTWDYDDAGRLIQETASSGITPYARVVYESNGVKGTQYRYGLGNQIISQSTARQDSYYLHDALGSTKALTDATGTLTNSHAYDAYGEMIARKCVTLIYCRSRMC